jgi:putative flippase GtrA
MRRFYPVFRFAISGFLATSLYFLIVNTLIAAFRTDPVAASVSAYLLSLGVSYLLQSRFTFRVRSDSFTQALRFLISSLAGLAIAYAGMALTVQVLKFPSLLGSAAVCALIPLTSYLLFNYWVFADSRAASQRAGDRI